MMEKPLMSDVRLIERWLPIAALGEECSRERRSLQELPPVYYLHVWWARRPLVASRAAILASLLPSEAAHDRFLHVLGIHGDPVAARRKVLSAKRTGVRVDNPYNYARAYTYGLDDADRQWLDENLSPSQKIVLDPTAGGGSIPFEAARLGISVCANDLNPVAALVLKATVEWPISLGENLKVEYERIAGEFRTELATRLRGLYSQLDAPGQVDLTYLWAHTVQCPHCDGKVPLSPNWRLSPEGSGVRLCPQLGDGPGSKERHCQFEIVCSAVEQSTGTVADGDGVCPYPDCGRVIDGDEIKRQAAEKLGSQLFAVVVKRRIETLAKAGKRGRDKWVRDYRAPRDSDDADSTIKDTLSTKLEEWQLSDCIPSEEIPIGAKTTEPRRYGMGKWSDFFTSRQLLCHGTSVEVYRQILWRNRQQGALSDTTNAAFVYLALALDTMVNYSNRSGRWDVLKQTFRSIFDRHDFAFCWSYCEMVPTIEGMGYDWCISKTAKAIDELIQLGGSKYKRDDLLSFGRKEFSPPPITISCKSGASLDHLSDASVDAVVMDPPYGANVMYAELSDFFYVWLKRTAGLVVPELFTRRLTDKQSEAVANKAHFVGQKGAEALANRDYQEKMSAIFAESRRVLKPNGIMTVMFTHKDTSAWDALTKGLIEAGFIITASWPVNTEAEGSLHIKDKAAANSTIFLVCRPRPAEQAGDTTYWEDVEPLVAKAVRTRVEEFQKAGIIGVDLYLASFGPALEEFSRHWPLKRGTPRPEPLAKKRRKQAELFEEEFDPYAVTPEDALDAARREVKTWRLNQLTHTKGRGELDPTTSWFVLAWDAFKAPVFSYDEGLRLARAGGADLDGQLIGKICEKRGSDIKLWDSATRAAKSALGPGDGSRAMIDAIHHAAHRGRTRTLDAAHDLLKDAGIDGDPQFLAALEAVLEVLPPSRNFVGFDVATGEAKSAADDFDALEKLRRLAFADKVDEPEQLSLFAEAAA
jgi:putative DNA methylase